MYDSISNFLNNKNVIQELQNRYGVSVVFDHSAKIENVYRNCLGANIFEFQCIFDRTNF
jgi:hypothetical protein